MRLFVHASLFLAVTALLATPALADNPWELVSNKNGIVVDRRIVDGTKLKEFRGRGVIDVPLATLLAVFSDIDHAVEWMDSCRASSVVEDGGDRMKVVYNRTKARWPVSDRDAVLRNDVFFDEADGRVRIEFSTVQNDKAPPVKGVVRMPYLRGHWHLWAESPFRTRVEYQVHANPGGSLPEWLVNYVSKELPRKTIVGLAAQVKRRSYPDMERHIRTFPEVQKLEQKLAASAR
jgi:hypothetical protein